MNETMPPPLASFTPPKTSALAIWSLVLGILAVVLVVICIGPVLFAIPAIICGHMACSRIKHSNGQLAGTGMAIAGFVTGYVSLALILLTLPIAIPNFVKARNTSMQNACIGNLRAIDAAANQFALENHLKTGDKINFPNDLTPYIKLDRQGKIPSCPAGGTYVIEKVGDLPTCSIPGHKLPQ
jgi:hypothetical protein